MLIAEMSHLSFIRQLLKLLWMHIGPFVRHSAPNKTMFYSSAQNHKTGGRERDHRPGIIPIRP